MPGGNAGEDALARVEQLEPIILIERAGRLDDAVGFEIGEHGGDDRVPNVACCGEVVDGNVERFSETQHAVDQIAERGRELGILVEPPTYVGGSVGYFTMLRDPDGHLIELYYWPTW